MAGLPKIGVQAVVENEDGYVKALKTIQKANDDAAQNVSEVAKKFDVLNDTTDYARSVQQRYAQSLKLARSALEDTSPKVDLFKEAISAAAGAVNLGVAAFNTAVNVIGAIGNIIGAVIGRVVDFGKSIFSSGLEFSGIMANISSITKKTGVDLHNLGKELIDIGSNSVAGPLAVADAYYDIAGGVQEAGVRMTILKQAIAVSEAGQADLKATTQGLINVMNAYNYGIAETTVAADVFTRTTDLGTRTLNEYVAALSPIAGLAASQKVGFDELGAAMSFMTTKGLTAGQAGTALQGIMTQLARNTPGVTRALKAMGESSIESSIANNGLTGTLAKLVEGAKKTGQNLQTLVGRVEAMKAVTLLGTDEFKNYFKVFMEGLDEATSKAREIQRLDVNAQLQLVAARFEGIGLSISQAVLPAFAKFLKFVNDSFTKIDWKKIGAGLDKIGERLGESVGKLTENLGAMLDQIDWDQLASDVERVFGDIANYIASIDWQQVVTGAQQFIQTIIQVGQGVTAFFTGAIEQATAFSVSWTGFWTQVSVAVNEAMNAAGQFISNAQATISAAIQGIVDFIRPIWDALFTAGGTFASAVQTALTQASTFITEALEPIQAALQPMIDAVTALWNSLFGEAGLVPTVVQTALDMARTHIDNALEPIKGSIQAIVTGAEAIWNALFGPGGSLVTPIAQAWEDVKARVEAAKDGIKAKFDLIALTIKVALQPAVDFINSIAEAIAAIGAQIRGLGIGGGGGIPGHALGGQLVQGWNIVGERGPELIRKVGGSATVYSNTRSNAMVRGAMNSANASLTRGLPIDAPAFATGTMKQVSVVKTFTAPKQGGGSGGGGSSSNAVKQAVAKPVLLGILDYIAKVGYETWSNQGRGMLPGAMPVPVSGGGGNSSVVNNRNIENVNFYSNRDTTSAVERFARLRMIRRGL